MKREKPYASICSEREKPYAKQRRSEGAERGVIGRGRAKSDNIGRAKIGRGRAKVDSIGRGRAEIT